MIENQQQILRRIDACGDDAVALAKVIYNLSEQWHLDEPDSCPAPDLGRAQAVAQHYISEAKRVGWLRA